MVALQVAVTVVLVRRRRRFGTLRPDVPIVPISACSVRGGLLRRADFTDGTRATYGGTARLRTALTTRGVTDLAIGMTPQTRKVLVSTGPPEPGSLTTRAGLRHLLRGRDSPSARRELDAGISRTVVPGR